MGDTELYDHSRPRVAAARLRLSEFRIHRVSKLGGEFAQQVTRLARELLEKKLADYEPKLVEKCNAAIERHAGEWRISLTDTIREKWDSLGAATQIPERQD